MGRASASAIIVSAIIAMTAVSVCIPFSEGTGSGPVSVIVPSGDMTPEDPMGLILGFESVSAEIGRSDGPVRVLMTGAPYEDGELFVAVTEAIGVDLFIGVSELDSLPSFEYVTTDMAGPDGHPPGDVDLDFLAKMLLFAESVHRWAALADGIRSEIAAQKSFVSKMNAGCVYLDSRSFDPSADRREDEDPHDRWEPCLEETEEDRSAATPLHVWAVPATTYVNPEADHSGSLPVIGRGTVSRAAIPLRTAR